MIDMIVQKRYYLFHKFLFMAVHFSLTPGACPARSERE